MHQSNQHDNRRLEKHQRQHGVAYRSRVPKDIKKIRHWIKKGDVVKIFEFVHGWTPVQIADLLIHLNLESARRLHSWLSPLRAAKVLVYINPGLRALLLQGVAMERIITIAEGLEDDDVVELLLDFPATSRQIVLDALSNGDALKERLAYPEDTAGSIMSNRFVAVLDDWDIGMATRMIRRSASNIETLHEIYVVNEARELVGRLKLRDLLLHTRDQRVGEIMRKVVVAVKPDADQEEVLLLAERNKLQTLPVLDSYERVIGRIALDELREVIRDEAEEDIKLMSGVNPDERPEGSLRAMVKGRLPWLIGGLVGASCAAVVVGSFEEQLEKAAILASFIPIVMAMAGNAGIQSSTVTVQGLATGSLWFGAAGKRIAKELVGALINGTAVALLLALLIFGAAQLTDIYAPNKLALAAGVSLALVTMLAATLGAAIPLILVKLRVDPAVATGVFITTSNDIFGVLIFFVMATSIYLGGV